MICIYKISTNISIIFVLTTFRETFNILNCYIGIIRMLSKIEN